MWGLTILYTSETIYLLTSQIYPKHMTILLEDLENSYTVKRIVFLKMGLKACLEKVKSKMEVNIGFCSAAEYHQRGGKAPIGLGDRIGASYPGTQGMPFLYCRGASGWGKGDETATPTLGVKDGDA